MALLASVIRIETCRQRDYSPWAFERALRDEVSLLQWSTRVLSAEILDGVFATDSDTDAPHCAAPPRARSVVSASSIGNHRVVVRSELRPIGPCHEKPWRIVCCFARPDTIPLNRMDPTTQLTG